ncbi:high-affinity iron permease, partial [Irineochytrium annulatum]
QFLERSLAHDEPTLLRRLKKHVWAGALSGLAIALAVGFALVFAVWVLKKDVLGGASEMWETGFECFALVLQTYLAVKLMTFSGTSSITQKWESKISHHLRESQGTLFNRGGGSNGSVNAAGAHTVVIPAESVDPDEIDANAASALIPSSDAASITPSTTATTFEYPFVILAFSVVLREGLESVIYLTGISAGEHPSAIALPGLIGIAGAITVGVMIHRFSANIELKSLMMISVTMMLVLSAGLASSVAGEVEEYVFEEVWGIDDGTTPVLWDVSFCCDEKTVPTFQVITSTVAVLSAMVGYRARPTVATMGTYIFYWIIVAVWTAIARASNLRRARGVAAQKKLAELQAQAEEEGRVVDLLAGNVAEPVETTPLLGRH